MAETLTIEEEYTSQPNYFYDPDDAVDFYKCDNADWEKFTRTDEVPSPNIDNIFDMIIGQDRAKKMMQGMIDSVSAGKKAYVLLIGPPGTGKSLLARGAAQEIEKRMPEYIPPENFDADTHMKKYYWIKDKTTGKDREVFTDSEIIEAHQRVMKDFPFYDQLVFPNKLLPSRPKIRLFPAGEGAKYVSTEESKEGENENIKSKAMSMFTWLYTLGLPFVFWFLLNILGIYFAII